MVQTNNTPIVIHFTSQGKRENFHVFEACCKRINASGIPCIGMLQCPQSRKVMVWLAYNIVRNGVFVVPFFEFILHIKNLIKSINVSCRLNVLDILLKNRNSIVSFILASIKAWRIRAGNRRERKNPTTFFHFPMSVCALRIIARNDARRSQNASMWIVTGKIEKKITTIAPQWFKYLIWKSKMGYDVGFIKDQYGCNTDKCECAHFDDAVIGKLDIWYSSRSHRINMPPLHPNWRKYEWESLKISATRGAVRV